MPTAIAPSPTVSPRVQLMARQQACLEQIVRRQTSPQRLVRRAKILLALGTGAHQCHVTRQMHLNRGRSTHGAGDGSRLPPSWSRWKPMGAMLKCSLR